jgi:hypothetical protein
MFLIDLVPCQNSGSLSMSDKTFQTSETGASIFFDVWKLAILQAKRMPIYEFVII